MREHEWSTRLMLNGKSVSLGTVADVVDKLNGRRNIGIGIEGSDGYVRWEFSGDRSEMSMSIELFDGGAGILNKPVHMQYMMPYFNTTTLTHQIGTKLKNLTYITAERIGPREFYELSDPQSAAVVGSAGEHAAGVLHIGRDLPVSAAIALPDVPPTRLRQVEARMRTFFPGCGIDVQQIANANAVSLGIRTSDGTDFHRPINVGFGITQVFPLVVAALSASKNDLLMIENPEVHLHPSGQVKMGIFLAEVARSGVQVLIETHSDHILNGIRRAVKAETLTPEQVSLHFFHDRSLSDQQVLSPSISKDGDIDFWPEGFFDQFDKDSSFFAGWGS
ncbi:Uncharacterized conserved protein [Comamonas terrigena]|nr:Uncharacterized conserved protein [Comamonas terrigena]